MCGYVRKAGGRHPNRSGTIPSNQTEDVFIMSLQWFKCYLFIIALSLEFSCLHLKCIIPPTIIIVLAEKCSAYCLMDVQGYFCFIYFKPVKKVSPSLTLICLHIGESDFQGKLWRRLPLHPVPHLWWLRHAASVQVFPGAVPQHSRLLHITAYRKEDLHPFHGGLLCCLHLNVYLWDDLPHLQTHTEAR